MASRRVEKFFVTYPPYKFLAVVEEAGGGNLRITFGGKIACISISVYADDPDAHISGIKYSKKCALPPSNANGNANATLYPLERASGTEAMVSAALQFVFRRFRRVRGVTLKDKSHVRSEVVQGLEIPLQPLYIAKHGKTWYEAKFGAELESPDQRARYAAGVAELRSLRLHGDYDEFFKSAILRHLDALDEADFAEGEGLREYYEQGGTLESFVRNALEDGIDGAYFADWLPNFVGRHVPVRPDDLWIIRRPTSLQERLGIVPVNAASNASFETSMARMTLLNVEKLKQTVRHVDEDDDGDQHGGGRRRSKWSVNPVGTTAAFRRKA
jgi:hypothetical protein